LVGPELPDLIAGLASLISLVVFVQFWKPKYRPEYAASLSASKPSSIDEENVNRRNSSIREHDGNSEKYEPQGTTSAEKAEIAHNEEAGDRVSLSQDDSLPRNETDAEEEAAVIVERPNLRESILAWSPWVLIIIVVIM
jgi:glycolate permease